MASRQKLLATRQGDYTRLSPFAVAGGIVEGLWIKEDTIKFMGSTLVTRMTVVVLPATAEHGSEETKTAPPTNTTSRARLFVHSPTPLSPQLQTDLSKLGTVAFIVSPNKIHNMSMPEWAKAYPEAKMIASPGLEARRPDVKFHATLGDTPPPEWADVLDQTLTKGNFFFSEAIFFHKPSRTLITCDMLESTHDNTMGSMGCLLACCLVWSIPKHKYFASPEHRWYTDDAAAVARTHRRISEWGFNKIIMSHGRIIESDAADIVDEVFDAWIREARGCSCSNICRCCCRCSAAYQ